MNWTEIDRVHPLLAQLRLQRFELGKDALQLIVEKLFEPIEYMSQAGFGGFTLNLSSFTVDWAWNCYWSSTTPSEVELVLSTWVPLLETVRLIQENS